MPALSLFDPNDEGRDVRQAVTVPQVVDLFIANLVARVAVGTYSSQALGDVRRDLLRFAARFMIPLDQCRQHDVTQWLNENPQWRATSTRKRIVDTIVGCFNWAEEEELIDRAPYKRPRILRGQPNHVRRPADPREYVALMKHTSSRELRRGLFFMRRVGVRTSEMCELRRSEVILDVDAPHLCLQKHKSIRRTGKPKLIGLDPATAGFLAALLRNSAGNRSDRVFVNTDGNPWDRHTFARHLRRTAKRIGLDEGVVERVSAYCLRHTYAVDGIEGGATAKDIADHFGHSDTRMVETIYASHTRDRLPHQRRVAIDINRRRLGSAARKKLDNPQAGKSGQEISGYSPADQPPEKGA